MKIYGTHDDRTIQQLQRCVDAEDGAIGVLCADGHLGYSMPIGGVVGYRNFVSPSGVGYDIACGNMAVQTNVMAADVSLVERERIADEIRERISFGIGRKNNEPIDDAVFEQIEQSPVKEQRALVQMAASQLGTVGSGNHYVDILEDEGGALWVACHFGSRGFGHKTASGFMNIAQGHSFSDRSHDGEMDAPPLLLDINTPSGQDYVHAMHIAGDYAYAGRSAVVQKALDILGAEAEFTVHNHHNFAWYELHGDRSYWVVRKGATPAQPGQWGFVGGSMGDISVILRGVESPESAAMLYSTVHGAGRVMSRTQAAGKSVKGYACLNYRVCDGIAPLNTANVFGSNVKHGDPAPPCPKCGHKTKKLKYNQGPKVGGAVDFAAEKIKLDIEGTVLRGAGADEAPPVYRSLSSVLAAHAGTIEIMHTLKPRIVVMAGGNEYDPYKD